MSTVTSIVQQFVAGLKSRHEETRSSAARDLKLYVSTELKEVLSDPDDVTAFMDEFNRQILEMISSQDISERKGGILAIGIIFVCVQMLLFFFLGGGLIYGKVVLLDIM